MCSVNIQNGKMIAVQTVSQRLDKTQKKNKIQSKHAKDLERCRFTDSWTCKYKNPNL